MKNYVITIARENGSNGRAIGEALAGRLGIPFYNRDILRMAADDSGINEQLFANAEKSFRSSCCSAWPRTPTTARSSRRTATTLFPTRTCSATRPR